MDPAEAPAADDRHTGDARGQPVSPPTEGRLPSLRQRHDADTETVVVRQETEKQQPQQQQSEQKTEEKSRQEKDAVLGDTGQGPGSDAEDDAGYIDPGGCQLDEVARPKSQTTGLKWH